MGVVINGQMRAGAMSEHESQRHPLQAAVVYHHGIALPAGRRNQLIGQSHARAQVHRPGDVGDEVIGAALDQKPVALDRVETTSSDGSSSTSRCAAARPVIPPPMTATRFRPSLA
jgi:hypothetical protein